MNAARVLCTVLGVGSVLACETPAAIDAGVPDAAIDGGLADAGPDLCEGFVVPARPAHTRCDEPSVAAPDELAACDVGSGSPGVWVVDEAGLPAYDLGIDQRCDPAGRAWSPRPYPLRDPIHAVGNGRGLLAMAHASGGVELYSQDRGHAWTNRIDTWRDARDPDYPPQLGGGFLYLVGEDGSVRSTRFEDLPLGEALLRQTRRFGVGYVETVTRWDDVVVRHRVLAPDLSARALVSEVSLETPDGAPRDFAVVEVWDPNFHQVEVELLTSDLAPGSSARIDRARRERAADYHHHLAWRPELGRIELETSADALPAGIDDRLDPSPTDWFPPTVYLARLDEGPAPDGVWLLADELWGSGTDRTPPAAVAGAASAAARTLDVDGAGQPAFLALRTRVTASATATVLRHAFGIVPAGTTLDGAVAELRAAHATIAEGTSARWRERVAWAAFPGLEHAGALQRELAWSSYAALASVTFDEYRGVRLLGQGGSYRFIHGLDGAIGDLALFADAILFLDPEVAEETLVYCLASQHGSGGDRGPNRYPYATTGVGSFSDVGIYHQRSDAYWLLPSSVARYAAATRDRSFLDREVAFWPRAVGETASVLEHVVRSLDYAEDVLGYAARGLPAMGTNDYADGVLAFADEPTTPTGTSSTFNALFAVEGLPRLAALVRTRDPALATRLDGIALAMTSALEAEAWDPIGGRYHRGFVDSGNPLAPDYLFVEPQVLPILAGLVDDARRDALLDLVEARFETPLGAMTTVGWDGTGPGGIDMPQVGGVWPVASAWVTTAFARRDPAEGWSSLLRNTLFRHAELYPEIWYGIWTGPDSYNGPDHERAGEADAHLVTALTDYPALNVHAHLGPLRALLGVLGVEARADGLRVAPRVPVETFAVRLPRLALAWAPDRVELGYVASADDTMTFEITLPSGLAAGPVAAEVDGTPASVTLGAGIARVTANVVGGLRTSVVVTAAP